MDTRRKTTVSSSRTKSQKRERISIAVNFGGGVMVLLSMRPRKAIHPFRTAVSFWGHSTQILSSLSPNRDCGTKRVNQTVGSGIGIVFAVFGRRVLDGNTRGLSQRRHDRCSPSFTVLERSRYWDRICRTREAYSRWKNQGFSQRRHEPCSPSLVVLERSKSALSSISKHSTHATTTQRAPAE